MIKHYKCTFLSDVVLQASSNTQGNVLLADFIAGSNFLGMVASAGGYDSFGADAFEVFHAGSVRFGDGHMVVNDKATDKIPLSYFNLKIGDGFYNRMHLSEDEEQSLRDAQKQLKQMRSGFMNEDGAYLNPSYNYVQKSQHSKEHRRSADEGMFGYSALKKGTEWTFKVTYCDTKYIEAVETKLLGHKKLGKSKSAQYGKVYIEPIEATSKVDIFEPNDSFTYLYLNSRLALIDQEGNPLLTPTAQSLGLANIEIDWAKTQLKNSSYHPYDYTRNTKESTRVVLNKGGVIVIKGVLDKEDISKLERGVGAYLNEGFGEIMVNPSFLKPKHPELKSFEGVQKHQDDNSKKDESLLAFLKNREEDEEDKFAVAIEVQNSYKTLLGASKSQWGEIRSIATMARDKKELFEEIEEFVSKGVAQKQWESIALLSTIKNSSQPIPFTKLLAKTCREHTKGAKNV